MPELSATGTADIGAGKAPSRSQRINAVVSAPLVLPKYPSGQLLR
jgi:hypothetical protein